jgi:pilus assembly protein CpaB
MESRRLMLALAAALGISVLCTVVLGRIMMGRRAAGTPTMSYMVAARSIAPGEVLKADSLRLASWPANHPVTGAFTRADQVIGRSSLYPIEPGQLLVESYLAAVGSGIGLTTKIPSGMRAVALKSDEVAGVAGFLFPGCMVDVLVTYRSERDPQPTTLTVLEDVQVIAVGHQIQPDPEGKPTTVNVVTVLVSEGDTAKVVLATNQGNVHFVLRNGGDHTQAKSAPVQLSELDLPSPSPSPSPKPKVVSTTKTVAHRPKPYTVETVLGEKRFLSSFN